MKRWQYLTFQEQMVIRKGIKPKKKKVKQKPTKKKLNIQAIKVNLPKEKLFTLKDWTNNLQTLKINPKSILAIN